MMLSYDGIVFDVLMLEDWMRQAVYTDDRTTFLYWHHVIDVVCVLNPDATAANKFPRRVFEEKGLRTPNIPGGPVLRNVKPNNLFRPRTDLPPDDPRTLGEIETAFGAAALGGGLGAVGLDAAASGARTDNQFEESVPGEPTAGEAGAPASAPIPSNPVIPTSLSEQLQRADKLIQDINQEREKIKKAASYVPPSQPSSPARVAGQGGLGAAAAQVIFDGAGLPINQLVPGSDLKASDLTRADVVLPVFGGGLGATGIRVTNEAKKREKARAQKEALREKLEALKKAPFRNWAGTVPITDVELRERLNRPRRQLLVWLYSGPNGQPEFMLASPLHPDARTDALHGPQCTVMHIPEIVGNVTAIMRLRFETWEAPPLEFDYVDTGESRLKGKSLTAEQILKQGRNPTTPEGVAIRTIWEKVQDEFKDKSVTRALIPDIVTAVVEQAIRTGLQQNSIELAKAALGAIPVVGGALAGFKIPPAIQKVAGRIGVEDIIRADRIKKRLLKTPSLLSNRWTMSFGWNPDTYLRTQTIQGVAIFRADVLKIRHLTADQMRGYIWHPIPEGYRRRPSGEEDITLSEDSLGVNYVIHDDEVLMNFPGGVKHGIIHAEVKEEFEYHGYAFNSSGLPESFKKKAVGNL